MQHMLDYEMIFQMVACCNCVYCWGDYYLLSANVLAQHLYAELEQVRVADLCSNAAPGRDSWSVQDTVSEEGLDSKWFWNALINVCGSFIKKDGGV